MSINLLTDIRNLVEQRMPEWLSIQSLIPSTIPATLLEYAQTHESTGNKIGYALYHYDILNQIYRPNQTTRLTDTPTWVLGQAHVSIFNLMSALDSFAHEINLAYAFHVNLGRVSINHAHGRGRSPNCIRCALDTINDNLTTYLNQELSQQWYNRFWQFRRQMVHRNIPVTQTAIRVGDPTTTILLPNDPASNNPMPADYSDRLDANDYVRDCLGNVIRVINSSYLHLQPRVRTSFNL